MSRLRGQLHDPVLSVVMPVFNEKDTIEEIIRRVLAVPMRIELIVIDDVSTDGTPAILEHGTAHRVVAEHGLERLAVCAGEGPTGGVAGSHEVVERSRRLDARRHDEAASRQQVGRDPPRPHVSPPPETIAPSRMTLSGSSR